MRYVRVSSVEGSWGGYSLDPAEYLRVLPDMQDELPEGARVFAADEEHYNFFGSRCVKDLRLYGATFSDRADRLSVEISFAPNKIKHEQGLTISYVDVTEFSASVTATPRVKNVWPETRRLGDLQLDEIMPHERGCSHEIQLTGGRLWIVSGDLVAEWRDIAS